MAVAVLGMGLLGSGFAENLAGRGVPVTVWNRTASKCAAAVAAGATQAATAAEAVTGASRVHLVLAEDGPVDAVIDAISENLAPTAVVIDHSTNAPDQVRARVERLNAAGITYVHAPVFMGPANSRDATGLMLVSGDPARIQPVLADLESMTGRVLDLGEDPSRAATVKLTGNAILIVLTAGMGDVFKMGAANGMTPEDCLTLFELFSPTAAGMGKRVVADGPVGFELTMARKDVRLMIDAAGGPDALSVLPGVAAAMDQAIDDGRGSEDFTQFVRG